MTSALFWAGSQVWSAVNRASRLATELHWVEPMRLDARVVSVGNLQAGGAGKTPLVAQIAREAVAKQMRVCILSRGYKGSWESQGGVILPGVGIKVSSELAGDEPTLLHELVPEATIGVGADRIRQFERAKAQLGTSFDLVILDDGFQHRRIAKDVEVVAVTSARRTERLFREWDTALASANLVVWTKGDLEPPSFGKPRVRVRYQLQKPGDPARNLLWLVTGVADHRSVGDSVARAGYRVIRSDVYADHARYRASDVEALLVAAEREQLQLATTGKDWVKWRDLGISKSRLLVLEPELVFEQGREHWDSVLWG
jgi:tetraacyldisaccharide 4'-kinase